MKKKLTNNLGMKLAALAIAVVLWLIIQSFADPQTTKDLTAKVEVRNADEALQQQDENYIYAVVGGETASFTIEGPTSIVSRLTASDFSVYADMRKLSQVYSVPVEIVPKRYASSISVRPHANTIQVELDEIVEKTMSVSVATEGTPADGYAVGNITSEPNLVKVRGPKKVLENADTLGIYVNVNGLKKDVTSEEVPKLYDKNGDEIIDKNIEIGVTSVKVTIEIWEARTYKVDLQIVCSAAEGYSIVGAPVYTPQELVIAAKPEDWVDFEANYDVKDGVLPFSVVSSDSLTNLTESKEGAFLISDRIASDKYKIMDTQVRENGIIYQITVEPNVTVALPVSTDKIQFKGARKDLTYRLKETDESISLNITGIGSEVDKAKNDTYEIYLDVSLITEPGEYPVKVEGNFAAESVNLAAGQELTIIVESTGEAESTGESGES